ncbi:hypothetical protein H8356DRAFT_1750037 [Neocallimastix lanati (nom. inval.)]|nr:hypothetical protein H8356DRAFT_1750037 [Neocallimastix sp. JGI-2020a]
MGSTGGTNLEKMANKLSSFIDFYQKKYPSDSYSNINLNQKTSYMKNQYKNAFSLSENFLNITTPIFKAYEDKINQFKQKIDELNIELKKMEQNSNSLYHENKEKNKKINEVLTKYKELGNEIQNLSTMNYELEKKNNIIEIQYNEAKDIIESIEKKLIKSNYTITEYENRLLEIGEKSKIIINENTELDSENNNLKITIQSKDKKIQSKENELKTISNGKDDIIKLLQKRINELTEDNEILLNNYNCLSDSYKKVLKSKNNSIIFQSKSKSLEIQALEQEKKLNELLEESLYLEEKIGSISNENNLLKHSNQQLNEQLIESNKEKMELKEKSNGLKKEIIIFKNNMEKYDNIVNDYKCCLKEMNMRNHMNNLPYVLPKILFNTIKKIKRLNNNDKKFNCNNENNIISNNNYNEKDLSKTYYNYEIKSAEESIKKIQRGHDDALRQINQISYENDI